MTRACLLFVVCWMGWALNARLVAQPVAVQPQYRFQHYDTNDGLPSDFVLSLATDSLGFVWMQYYGGVSRFDGYNFRTYKHDVNDTARSLPAGTIPPVFADPSGNIWVIPYGRSHDFPITKYDRTSDSFIKYRPDLKGAKVRHLQFDNKDPVIWLASDENGLFSFNTETLAVRNYRIHHHDSLIRREINRMTDVSDRDSCLLISSRKGIWLFDKVKEIFSRPNVDPADSAILYNLLVTHLGYRRNSDYAFTFFDKGWGTLIVSQHLAIVHRFNYPPGFNPFNYERDKEKMHWMATYENGLYRYNPKDSSLLNFAHTPGDINSLKSNNLNYVTVDNDDNIWVATNQGVSRLTKPSLSFYNFDLKGGKIDASTVYQANGQDYVIINKRKTGNQHEILIAPILPDRLDSLHFKKIASLKGTAVHGFWKGSRHLWISVYENGIIGLPINPKNGMIEAGPPLRYSHDPLNSNTISSNSTIGIWEDPDKNLWVCTRGGGLNKIVTNVLYGSEGSVVRYRQNEKDPNAVNSDVVFDIRPADDQSSWVLTDKGVDLFRNNAFSHVISNKNIVRYNPYTNALMIPYSFHQSGDGNLFVGGPGGLFQATRNGDRYELIKSPLVENEDVVAIQEDMLGRLWLSSAKGIVFVDQKKQTTIEFNQHHGFEHAHAVNVFKRVYQTSMGIFVIADEDGLTLFDPLSIRINESRVVPVLTQLKVNNKIPVVGTTAQSNDEFLIHQDIGVLDELVLDYLHNNFSLEFSAMEMTAPEKNVYRYKLEGYDRDWIETDHKSRVATYTNLEAGSYKLKVKASNHHGIWSDHETILHVQILPPPWKTWWAYSLYCLAFVGIILLWRNYENKRLKLKHRAEHLSELDELKTRFFANISHEFRTPITLMLGPLKEMYSGTFNGDQKAAMGVMMRNGQRLLRLINQLLDLSKVEAGKMNLQAHPADIVQFLKEIASSYESLAGAKNIKYLFYPEMLHLIVYIDSEKIEKVVHNLLSNAFKFTNEGGEVILHLKADARQAVITVKDTGIGIPAGQLDKVFDRFYQVDGSHTRAYEGSGLGMALAKELVELHHGAISVAGTAGRGTIFTVMLPLGKAHLTMQEIAAHKAGNNKVVFEDLSGSEPISTDKKETPLSSNHPVLLIVEDNADMRNYIRRTLSEHYHITEAPDGKEGLKMAVETIPDLIISDIMMPEMDGYQLCEQVKTRELTGHIPVILLTAKADRESKLAGLGTGADDYLSKPFDGEELKLIVKNHIEAKRKMRERFSREITLEPTQIQITSLDAKFVQKMLGLIEAHMEDEDFSIEDFSQEAGYSRMQFYRKIKSLSGQTPSQFVRTIRLKRAAQLLSQKSDNVTQIAYSVGFSSLAYFNKCFKDQYGVTPGRFADESAESNAV